MSENNLNKVIAEVRNDPDKKEEFAKTLAEYSKNNTEVYSVLGPENRLVFYKDKDKQFLPIFVSEENIVNKGNKVFKTNINNIVKQLMEYPAINGMVINPFSNIGGVCIETWALLKMIFGSNKVIEVVERKYSDGIPEYTSDDVMEFEDIVDFGVRVFIRHAKENNIDVIFFTNELNRCPNVIANINGRPSFIYLKCLLGPEEPTLTYEERLELTKRGKDFNMDCYFAPIVIMSKDKERANAKLALKGDAFMFYLRALTKVEAPMN